MRITMLGHAGVYVEAGRERILVDPILRTTPLGSGQMAHCYQRELELARMPAPTVLAITHEHLDHLDAESLTRIPRDLPLVAPDDERTLVSLRGLGFTNLRVLDAWQSVTLAGVRITATPTDSGVDEVGYIFDEEGVGRYWHMSDAEANGETGERVLADHGPADVVTVKYQPASTVMAQQFRSLGAGFDKHELLEWLEAACATEPRLVIPYASGIGFLGRHEWMNRYIFPFRAEEIVELLQARLGSAERACAVRPGDVITIEAGRRVTRLEQASEFVRCIPGAGEPTWEPLETHDLALVDDEGDRQELRTRLDELLVGPWAKWLAAHLDQPQLPLHHYRDYGVVWQLVVHAGKNERWHYSLDFREPRLALRRGLNRHANFWSHMAGGDLLEILRGKAGAELLYSLGGSRLFEKIVHVRDGQFWMPPVQGLPLFLRLADPITFYLRWFAPKRAGVTGM